MRYSKWWKNKDLQPKLLSLTRLPFKNWRRNKEFPRQEKAKAVCYHQTSITRNVKELVLRSRRKRKKQNRGAYFKKINTYLSIISLNVNGLNAPIKRHRVAEWIRKQDPYICSLQETHLRMKDTHRLKVKGQKKIFHANKKERKAGAENTYIWQNRLQNKGHNKRHRRTLHNVKWINPTRGCNPR